VAGAEPPVGLSVQSQIKIKVFSPSASRTNMSLEVIHKEHEGIEILDLKGRLTFGQEDLDFRTALDRLVKAGKIRVVLNLSDLAKLDTTGLGTLLFALAKLRKAGGNLAIFNVKLSHIELLTEARLEAVFEVFQDEQDAINSFFPSREVKRYDILEFVESKKLKRPKP
jgi:anti-sigma B factor antagonist